jgi:hypothetical protein
LILDHNLHAVTHGAPPRAFDELDLLLGSSFTA